MTDEASVRAFAAAEPHPSVMGRLANKMGATRFETVRAAGKALPLAWRDVIAAVD